jgi:hypothetical protein
MCEQFMTHMFCLGSASQASGIESFEIPAPDLPAMLGKSNEKNAQILKSAEDVFQTSEFLSSLKQRSTENKDR